VRGGGPISVLHVNTERGWRGGERQVLWLAEAMARAGHRPVIAARPGEPLALRAAARGLEVMPSAPFFEGDPVAAFALRRAIRQRDIQIVHAHSGHAVALGALATLGTRARLVVSRHIEFRLRDNPATRWKYGRADAIIAVASAVGAGLVANGVPESRVHVIQVGVDLARTVAPATASVLAELGATGSGPLVVQVAALVAHKDPFMFLRAMVEVRREIPGVRALLVGDGPMRREVAAMCTALGLDDSVHLTGFREDADALIAAADVVTLSSNAEGLPTVLLDALAFGRPVAATAVAGLPDLIDDGVNGLVTPIGDHGALARAVVRILREPGLAQRLVAAGRSRILDFSMEHVAERTVAVYDAVLGHMPRVVSSRHD
jgi:glycosyltransferase involved in cell wall biosynthesis